MSDRDFNCYLRSKYRLEQLQELRGPAFVIAKEREILKKAAGALGERLSDAEAAYPDYRAMMTERKPDDQEPLHYPQ